MRRFLFFAGLICILYSCQKKLSYDNLQNSYVQQVQFFLKDSLSNEDYAKVDVTSAIISKTNSRDTLLLRIGFKQIPMARQFILLKTNRQGISFGGNIIRLDKIDPPPAQTNNNFKNFQFNGVIEISSFNRKSILRSNVENGYVLAFHSALLSRTRSTTDFREMIVPGSDDYLPEVIVVAYLPSPVQEMSFNTWYALQSLFSGGGGSGGGGSSSGGQGGDGYGGTYSPADPYGGGGYSSNGNNDGSNNSTGFVEPYQELPADNPKFVDFETQDVNPPIDVDKYINCFSAIPDAGSVCSIEIMADIPVDSDPNKLFNVNTGSPGHTFIQLRKSNQNQSILQNIGFYPETGYKTMLTDAPVKGKFVDNGGHEFNASYKIILTPEQLKTVLKEISNEAKYVKYDLDEFNCTDFALKIFNSFNPRNYFEIPLYDIPGGMAPNGTSTPQGVYNMLKSMKVAGSPEAANITIPPLQGFVASSSGPCN